ncbi:Ribosomal protein S18 acetylase RimI [Mucilaginibacter lappiensis]|uniref:GNAT superfamily N-acetyltransferase n=1 Tax=Mucilaginibacter lappiensis TaxID=354630 RepID=A0ABR6PTI6_9SPHI|nr:GNAT family N-acetyltransferase [Mucilaginibacter lappiensis]MBB6112454.1 GNAT superfamily N-acetyltransferase [Mucilaginibacter lappiensis]SIS00202.1 Ribosomal protein S18 acetylase RimI [Mucilaginibacter lappiensis]
MEQINIRKAELKDLDVLFEFKQALVEAERPFDPTLKPGPLYYYNIPELIEAAGARMMVAEIDSKLIGCGYAHIVDSKPYLKHQQHTHLGFMYVMPEHRGKGVNKLIIHALKQWSKQQGITEIRLEVYAFNTAALKAYEKVGFAPHMLTMRLGLADETS